MDNGASSYRRYLNGDERAFRELVQTYFDDLVFFIDRYTQDTSAAEDVALDVFTDLVVNRHRYNFKVTMKTYLFMLGRSRALDYIKCRNARKTADLSEAEQLPADGPTPEELLLANDRKRTVNQALAQLSGEMQEAVHLVYFEQLSCEEVAKIMKKNRKQVYNLLYRAKMQLRTILGEEGEIVV